MEYAELVELFRRLEETASDIEKTSVLAAALRDADDEHLPVVVKLVRGKVFAPWRAEDLGISSGLAVRAISRATGVDEERIEDDWRETGDLGDAAARAIENRKQRTLFSETLDVRTVHETLAELAGYEGAGSQRRRVEAVAELLSSADPDEARYVVRTVVGAMRLGVGEGTVRDAIAEAFLGGDEEAVAAVERAHQVTNDFGVVARTAREEGMDGLAALDVELFRPVKAMLAQKAEDLDVGLADVADQGDVLLEYKYDGVRVKAHGRGDEVRLFTRRLEDVTEQFPEVADAVRERVAADEFILEGELVAYDPDTHEFLPFQHLSRRVKRKEDISRLVDEIPVVCYLFDALYFDGESLLDVPLRERIERLEGAFSPVSWTLERATYLTPTDTADAEEFYEEALAAGHEGVMLKNLAAAYQPGSRVGYMMKVKPTMEPLDLVVVGAEWSEGRKSDFLGRLHLACREAETGEFRKVGNMHAGLTDAQLEEVTDRLEPLVTEASGRAVTVRPAVVVEVEYEEIQRSSEYDSGFALRFPRFDRFRDELAPEDADTLERVRKLYEGQ